MSLFRYGQILDKFLFGDVTRKDFRMFAETELHFNPDLKSAVFLIKLAKDKKSSWVSLESAFQRLIAEMNQELPSINRFDYIRQLHAEEYNQLINSISETEIDYICHADRGMDIERHKVELKKVIFEQNGLITDKQYWFPYETIELASYVLDKGHEREFAICNCIVAKNVLWDNDSREMAWAFENAKLMSAIASLPSDIHSTVMKALTIAFRYEKAEEINPHYFQR